MTASRTVLVVSPGPDLANPSSGAGTRLQHLSRGLAERDWTVLALASAESVSERPEWVEEFYTFEQWSLPFLTDLNPSFVAALAHVLRERDVDVVHTPSGVCTASALARVLGGRATYAAQNVEADHAADFVDPTLPAYKRLLGPSLIPLVERAWVACAGRVTTVSDADRETFLRRYGVPDERIETIPTGTEDRGTLTLEDPANVRERYGLAREHVAVFHGWYEHPPNEEAVDAIRDVLAPAAVERGLDVDFLVVGKGTPEVDHPNVTTAGFVDDLFSVLNAADVAVVPISHGGGTKTKVYDYVTLGLPVVTTRKGVQGIDLVEGRHAAVVDAVDERFVDRLADVLESPERRRRMRTELLSLATDWSWDRSVARLDAFYRT